jgi:hypothetical protein
MSPWILRADILPGCRQDRFDNVVIASTVTHITLEIGPDCTLVGLGSLAQQGRYRHHHTKRAKTALQTMMILKGLLDPIERPIGIGLALDRTDLGTGRLGRKHGAGFHRIAVYMHDASPALASITPYMGAC